MGLVRPARACALALCIGLFLISPVTPGIDRVEIRLGGIEGERWRAKDVILQYSSVEKEIASVVLRVGRIEAPPPFQDLDSLILRCRRARITSIVLACSQGVAEMQTSLLDAPRMRFALTYRRDTGDLKLTLADVGLAGGRANVHVQSHQGQWRATLKGEGLSASQLGALTARFQPHPYAFSGGRIDLDATVQGRGRSLSKAHVAGRTTGLAFSDAEARNAGEDLAGRIELQARHRGGQWRGRGSVSLDTGYLCVALRCQSLEGRAASLDVQGDYREDRRSLRIETFQFTQTGIGNAKGSLDVDLGESPVLRRAELEAPRLDLKGLYESYLQSFLYGTPAGELEASGTLRLALGYARDAPLTLRAELNDIYLDDAQSRFGLYGLEGKVQWSSTPEKQMSRVSWKGGHLYRLTFGSASLSLSSTPDTVELAEAARIPVLDGSLRIDELSAEGIGTARPRWRTRGALAPIQMETFSQAMGWPVMSGQLSGVIPEVRYEDETVYIGGALLIRAFDGEIVIRNTSLEDPFGVVPKLHTDVDLYDVDLDQLTRTFSFGTIQGRLEGSIRGLEMSNWEPVTFDARLATPRDDRSRHRISQKAVDNLTAIGGGVQGALSRSFLRWFDEFSYDRLGIECKLSKGVCEMSGVGPADGGFYIVKGGGIPPRIDVIGFNRRVDWSVLVQRLKNATLQSPVVE